MDKPTFLSLARASAIVANPESPDHAEACLAIARALNASLDGAPLDTRAFALACAAMNRNPTRILCALVEAEILLVEEGVVYLGAMGRAFVTAIYVAA